MWQPYNPVDTSSFTAYNSPTCLARSLCTNHSSRPSTGQDSIITEPETLSLSPLNVSYTPHMIKDILRGTPGFPEEEEVDVEDTHVEEDEVQAEDAHIEEEDDSPVWPSHHLAQVHHLLNPLSLLLPNTCFSSTTSLPDR